MRGFVVKHEKKRFVRGPLFQQGDTEVSQHIGGVALVNAGALTIIEHRIKVASLARQNFPMIKTGRITAQVPLADHGSEITRGLEQLGNVWLRAVKVIENRDAVLWLY